MRGARLYAAAYAEIQERAIRDVVQLQEDAGLQVVTDGEFRRSSYWGRFVERCSGFEIKPAVFKFRDDHGHEVDFTATYATAKLARTQPLAADEFAFLRSVAKVTPKITMPAPSTMHFYRCTDFADPKVYADRRDLLRRPGENLPTGDRGSGQGRLPLHPARRGGRRHAVRPRHPRAQVRRRPGPRPPGRSLHQGHQRLRAGRAGDMVIGVHMCRGNFRGRYLSEGGYESVAERFFADTKVTHFLLEYDTGRAGDFKPLRFVPPDKGVVLGLVSTKTPVLETVEDLQRRTGEAAKFIDLDRLGIGPQCGFASTAAGNPLTEKQERAKLRLLVDAARAIWG